MIPKIIHYCWFGGNPLPDEAKRYIESWRRFCPGYEIKEWNESNFDVNACIYTKQAAQAGKWAFVSDYARFKILYAEGGLYFDTDVELIRPIDDIVAKGPFMGCEAGKPVVVAPGLGLGALPGDPLYDEIIKYYESQHFFNDDGSVNTMTIVTRVTEILKNHGYKGTGECEQVYGQIIYPDDYFCPMNYWNGDLVITENTRSIHHYSMTWKTKNERTIKNVERFFRRKLGDTMGMHIFKVVVIPMKIYGKLAVWGNDK